MVNDKGIARERNIYCRIRVRERERENEIYREKEGGNK